MSKLYLSSKVSCFKVKKTKKSEWQTALQLTMALVPINHPLTAKWRSSPSLPKEGEVLILISNLPAHGGYCRIATVDHVGLQVFVGDRIDGKEK